MSRQERKRKATCKVDDYKKLLVKHIGSPFLFKRLKHKLTHAYPQEKTLINRACKELRLA